MAELAPILIVEDDDDSRVIIASLLSWAGYPIVAARNGEEGLRKARREHPCLILLDLAMPIMDGPAFRSKQLADPDIADIPVLCISGIPEAAETSRKLDAIACIQKPIRSEELIATVEAHCRRHHSRKGDPARELTTDRA
jgi:DNA-binding response OmpR family regulator